VRQDPATTLIGAREQHFDSDRTSNMSRPEKYKINAAYSVTLVSAIKSSLTRTKSLRSDSFYDHFVSRSASTNSTKKPQASFTYTLHTIEQRGHFSQCYKIHD
jgi:hypothetical protein